MEVNLFQFEVDAKLKSRQTLFSGVIPAYEPLAVVMDEPD
jgi:hypothetical protein